MRIAVPWQGLSFPDPVTVRPSSVLQGSASRVVQVSVITAKSQVLLVQFVDEVVHVVVRDG